MGCAVETSKPKRRRKGLSTAHPYGELSEAAKARAREVWREKAWDSVDSELLTEQFAEVLEYEFGIEARTHPVKYAKVTRYEPEIEWSLSYCQGDGVSFKADVDIEKIVAHGVPGCEYFSPHAQKLAELWKAFQVLEAVADFELSLLSITIEPQHRHTHDVTSILWEADGAIAEQRDLVYAVSDAMRDELNALYSAACRRLEKLGYAEIEYHDSDEYLDDELTANDHYLFTEEGDFDS